MNILHKRTSAELLLVLITFVWGASFVVVKAALNEAAPLPWLVARFGIAGVLLLMILAREGVDRLAVFPGLLLGAILFGGFAFQTFGQKYTTPAKCAFITGFSVILVPVIMVGLGQRIRAATFAGAIMGVAGIYFLVLPSGLEAINRGDVCTLLCSVCFAIHIVMVGRYNQRYSFRHLAPLQILSVAVLALAAFPFDRDHHLHWTLGLGAAILFASVFATAFAFSAQNWAQRYAPPAHTALIFTLEPVFAALFSFLFRGEQLGGKALWGSVLILTGMLISELWGERAPLTVEG